MSRILTCLVFICVFNLCAWSQTLSDDSLAAMYQGENGAFTHSKEFVDIDIKNGTLLISAAYESEAIYFNDNAYRYSHCEIEGNEFDSITNVEAYSLIPDGKKYMREKVEKFNHFNKPRDEVFFENNHYIDFYFPQLKKNARSVLKYQRNFTDPHLLTTIFFSSYLPTVKKEVIIRYDKDVKIACFQFNCDSFDIKVNEYTKQGKNYRCYEINKAKKYVTEESSPGILCYAPHMIITICGYNYKGKEYDVTKDLGGLYRWDYSFVSSRINVKHEEISHIADSLCEGISNPLDKIRRLYYWMQDNINYVAFEDGYSGFIPRSPELVLHKRYGDCKDMAILLCSLLKRSGIEAYPGWVGTREKPYTFSALPSIASTNHMIVVCYDSNHKCYFLDPTSSDLSVFLPSKFIQGKEVLVGIDSINYRIEKVPEISRDTNSIRNEIKLKIGQNREVDGSGKSYISGYFSGDYRSALAVMSEDEKSKFIKNYIAHGQNKLNITRFNHTSLRERELQFEYNYDFRLPDYYNQNLDEIYINLSLSKNSLNTYDLKSRRLDIENDFCLKVTDVVDLELPGDYKIKYLPAGDKFNHEDYGFVTSYKVTENNIRMERTFFINTLLIRKASFPDWNDLVKKLNAANSESIVLIKQQK